MSNSIFVETDVGDCLKVLHPSGAAGGKAILAFAIPVCVHCEGNSSSYEVAEWLTKLEATEMPVCRAVTLLIQSLHTHDSEDYKTVGCSGNWTDIELLLREVKGLLTIFVAQGMEPSWFYEPQDTIRDFQALIDIVVLNEL